MQRLKEQLQAVDLLFEVRDARLPLTSMHPKTKEFFGTKPRVLVFCKEDLADPQKLQRLITQLETEDQKCIALSLKQSKGKDRLIQLASKLCSQKLAARHAKGLLPRPLRAAVVGLPNVGKSSLINWICGQKKAAVANTPGVTRGNSWVRISPQIELLDTPGMLPQAQFKGKQAMKLAFCNLLPQEHYDAEEVAMFGLEILSSTYPASLDTYKKAEKQKAENSISEGSEDPDEFKPCDLECVAKARACLKAGAVPDLKRAAALFLSEFRKGKLGRVMLDSLEAEL